MFATTKTTIRSLTLIALLATGTAAMAHPEMDRYGRDISGRAPSTILALAADESDITGSISQQANCGGEAETACPADTNKPARVRPDY